MERRGYVIGAVENSLWLSERKLMEFSRRYLVNETLMGSWRALLCKFIVIQLDYDCLNAFRLISLDDYGPRLRWNLLDDLLLSILLLILQVRGDWWFLSYVTLNRCYNFNYFNHAWFRINDSCSKTFVTSIFESSCRNFCTNLKASVDSFFSWLSSYLDTFKMCDKIYKQNPKLSK